MTAVYFSFSVPMCLGCGSGEPQQAIQERLQHLEKELFFYKFSSRQLKKKLKDLQNDTQNSVDQLTHSHEHEQTHTDANQFQAHNEEAQARRHILTTYTKIQAEHTVQQTYKNPHVRKHSHQTPCSSASSDLHVHRTTNVPEYHRPQMESEDQRGRGTGQSGQGLVMTPVRLCRRELRQISPAKLQATRRRQPALDASLESMLEDSIEVSKNTDRWIHIYNLYEQCTTSTKIILMSKKNKQLFILSSFFSLWECALFIGQTLWSLFGHDQIQNKTNLNVLPVNWSLCHPGHAQCF